MKKHKRMKNDFTISGDITFEGNIFSSYLFDVCKYKTLEGIFTELEVLPTGEFIYFKGNIDLISDELCIIHLNPDEVIRLIGKVKRQSFDDGKKCIIKQINNMIK